MDGKMLLLMVFGGAVVLFMATILLFQWLSRKNTGAGSIREYEELRRPAKQAGKRKVFHFLQQLYLACEKVPPLRAYLMKIRKRLSILHVYEEWRLRLETIKIALAAWSVLSLTAIPLVWFGRDPMALLLAVTGIWVGHGMMADAFVHRLEQRLLRQLRHFLVDVRHHYHCHGMVEEAIYDAGETAPDEMAAHAEELVDILTASNSEGQLETYYEVAPNRFLKGLAGVSHLVKEYGDKTLANGSLYLKALGKLTTEINLDILRREKLSYLLQGLTAIALAPLLFTQPIEIWARSYFPAMDAFYDGKPGWITKIGIMLVILGAYVLLRKMQELDGFEPVRRRRKAWEQRVYGMPWVRWIVDRLRPVPGTREEARHTMLLKETHSPIRLEWFTVRRAILAGTAFGLTLGLFLLLHAVATHHLLHAPVKSGNLFGEMSPEEQTAAREKAALDRRVIESAKEVKDDRREAVLRALRIAPQLTEEQTAEHAQRILQKMEQLDQEYLKWWEVLLSLLGGWGGYFLPVWILKFQRRMRRMDMKHEVDQFYAVIAMLSEMDRMSVEQLLEWMERFAVIFKEPLQSCLLHYEHGAEQALEQLKEEAPFLPFVRLVEKLQLSVEKIPIRQAFDDVETEQAFAQEQRKQDYERLIEAKAGWGKMIGFAPMMSLIFLYLVFPLVYISLSQMSVYYEQIQKIQ